MTKRKKESQMEWIPISKKLPPEDEEVLVTDGNIVEMACLDRQRKKWYVSRSETRNIYEDMEPNPYQTGQRVYTHWMLVPEPPEEPGKKRKSAVKVIKVSGTVRLSNTGWPELVDWVALPQ